MAASKLQANWTNVQHGATAITRVDSVSFSPGGTLQSYKGDDDHYPTVIVNLDNQPTATVQTSDPAVAMGIAPGTVGTLTATHKDAKHAAAGDIVYSLANAVLESVTTSGGHGQFGTATMTFKAFSSDGTTNPLSFSRV